MIKVRVKGEGVKLANRWCFINDEAIIDLEEYERNKEYVDIIEEIEKASTGEGQNPEGEQENSNNDDSDTNVGNIEGENNPEGDNEEDVGENNESEDEELEALKERAKELGIKNTHNMKKETLIAKIQEIEKASTGEGQNPEGE